MKPPFLVIFLLSAISCFAQKLDGLIIETTKVTLSPYESVEGIDWYYAKEKYQQTTDDKSWSIEKVWYYSDGLKVAAFVATPSKLEGKYPLVIFNRGSAVRNDIAYVHAPLFRELVKHGFVVLAPALRQSEGSEGKDEIGGADLHDLINIEKVYKQMTFVDQQNVFMLGESRGGIMTYLAIKEGMKLNAAATVGAITDFESYLKDNPWIKPESIWPEFPQQRKEICDSRSALMWPERITVPLLIMNGGDDPQVRPYYAIHLANRLSDLKKPYQLKIFQGGNHILSGAATNERDREVIEWFKKFVK